MNAVTSAEDICTLSILGLTPEAEFSGLPDFSTMAVFKSDSLTMLQFALFFLTNNDR